MTFSAFPVLKKTLLTFKIIGINFHPVNEKPFEKWQNNMSHATKKDKQVYYLTNWQSLFLALRVRLYLIRKWPLVTYSGIIHSIVDAVFRWIESPQENWAR